MRLAISGNLEKSGLRKTVGALVRQLDSLGMDYAVDRRIAELLAAVDEAIPPSHVRDSATWLAGTDILVALGGDGTILAAAREVGELAIPILGVNLGKLGFLAEVTPEDLSSAIRDLHAGNFRIEERLVIEATSPSAPGKTLFAVNDVVVDKARSSRVIDLETHIDGEYAVSLSRRRPDHFNSDRLDRLRALERGSDCDACKSCLWHNADLAPHAQRTSAHYP